MYRVHIRSIKQNGAKTIIKYDDGITQSELRGYVLTSVATIPHTTPINLVYTRDGQAIFQSGGITYLKVLLTKG
jgi:enterochelin esterase-like enzyme